MRCVCVGAPVKKLLSLGKFRGATGRRVILGLNFLVRGVKILSPSRLEIKKSNFFRDPSQILPKKVFPNKTNGENCLAISTTIFQEEQILHAPFRQFVLGKNHGILRAPPQCHPRRSRNKALLRDYVTNHHHPHFLGRLALRDTLRLPFKKGCTPPLKKLHGSNCPADCPPASNLLACEPICFFWHGRHTQNFDAPVRKVKSQIGSWKVVVQGLIWFSGASRLIIIQEPHLFPVVDDHSQFKGRLPCKSQVGHVNIHGWWLLQKNTAIDRCIARLYSSKPSGWATCETHTLTCGEILSPPKRHQ